MTIESPDTIHGRMKEGAHIAGYSLQRSMENLRWLLEDARYKQLSAGYQNVNEFLRSTQDAFKLLNIRPEERKQIAELVKELQPKASQRAIADMVGVTQKTIGADLGAEYSPGNHNNHEGLSGRGAEYSPPITPPDDYDPIEYERKNRKAQERIEERDRARQVTAKEGETAELPISVTLTVGDFREVMIGLPENSVDLIFTDPPYDEKSIPLYGDLARLAAKVLRPGGNLITYVGHYAIGDVLNLMVPHLRFWWTLAVQHTGNAARLPGKWIFVEWKPMLWFVKERRGHDEYVADMVISRPSDKKAHEWQQGITEAEYYIEHLTGNGDLILDPFAGSGTTLIAAHHLGRKSIGIEKDETRANVARARIETECK